MSEPTKKLRGLACVSPERRKAIARLGALALNASGQRHSFDTQEARAAGLRGGVAVSRDREHMARIGAAGRAVRQARRIAARKATPPVEGDPATMKQCRQHERADNCWLARKARKLMAEMVRTEGVGR